MQQVITYYLEMKSAGDLLEKTDANDLLIIEAQIDEFRFNKFLYTLVGSAWQWTEKLSLTDQQWQQYVENPQLRT